MGELVMSRADVRVMLWHMALYGCAAILEEAGVERVTARWTEGMRPLAVVGAPDLEAERVAELVREHARARAEESWLQVDLDGAGTQRGLMSPRIATLGSRDAWTRFAAQRHRALDELTDPVSWFDLRMVAALGEPAYWSRDPRSVLLQDDGASRLEMQPRNQGSEFVGSRLRKVANAVAARDLATVERGLTGALVRDEVGHDRADSRTPTGFASPGPTDSTVAWCALWGISQLPSAARVDDRVVTSGHAGRSRKNAAEEWFHLPFWRRPLRPARLRSILASRALRDAASAGLPARWRAADADVLAASGWLLARHMEGILRFPIRRFGSDSAPERRAMLGSRLTLGS